MLRFSYGGPHPGSRQILDIPPTSYPLLDFMVNNRSYIYILIDGRGSAARGAKLKFAVYRNLGKYEVEDQITATK